jgi:L-lactate dehydrogenase complex protein LldG
VASREAILNSIRAAGLPDEPAPPPWPSARDTLGLRERFRASLETAGGTLCWDEGFSRVEEALSGLVDELGARTLHSAHPALASRPGQAAEPDPRALAGIDLAVLPGTLAVAENGAVWITPARPLDRAASLLAEHLLLVVPARALVPDLHAAYAQIDIAAQRFGCFVSGPSKTADIEQALVVGAHGPRALTVLLTRH